MDLKNLIRETFPEFCSTIGAPVITLNERETVDITESMDVIPSITNNNHVNSEYDAKFSDDESEEKSPQKKKVKRINDVTARTSSEDRKFDLNSHIERFSLNVKNLLNEMLHEK